MAVDSTARAAAAFLTRPSASAAQPMGSLVASWTTVWLPASDQTCVYQGAPCDAARESIDTSLLCWCLPLLLDNFTVLGEVNGGDSLQANTTCTMAWVEWQVGSLITTCITVRLLVKQPVCAAFVGNLSILLLLLLVHNMRSYSLAPKLPVLTI